MDTVNQIDEHQEGEFCSQHRPKKIGSGFYTQLAC